LLFLLFSREIFSVRAVVLRENPHLRARAGGENSDAVAVFPLLFAVLCFEFSALHQPLGVR